MNVPSTAALPGATRSLVLAALALAGCTLFDTRPGVEILPGGDLVGRDSVELRVEAGGAPEARILVDGKPLGSPIPTGVDVRVDVSTVPEGVHELVARVEQSPSPRTSAPRRLEVRKFGYQVPVEIVGASGPWEPLVAEVRSPDPLASVTANVRDAAGDTLPCDVAVVSADRRTWSVSTGLRTLRELGSASVEVEATDDLAFTGRGRAVLAMPSRIAVDFEQPSGRVQPPVRIVASAAVPVPSATLWVSGVGRPAMPLREVGPSPWSVPLGEAELAPGAYSFEFRRDDVQLDGRASATVVAPAELASCSVEGGGASVTPVRCGVVTFRVPPFAVALEGTAFGEAPPGDLAFLQASDRSWRICPSDVRWKRGPVPFTATIVARDSGGAVLERLGCPFTLGWQWADPGSDPVSDGADALRGRVLAVHAPSPDAARIALQGGAGTVDAGLLRVATRAGAPGVFTVGDIRNGDPIASAAATLGSASALAWTRAAAPSLAEGLLHDALGAAWTPWPLSIEPDQGARSPSLASDSLGPQAVAWVEDSIRGTSVVRVRWAGAAWAMLAPIAPSVPGGRIEAPSVAPAGPAGPGPHVGFIEVWPDDSQRARVVGWDGAAWIALGTDLGSSRLGPRTTDSARVHLAADSSHAWVYLQSRTKGFYGFTWKVDPFTSTWQAGPGALEHPSGLLRTNEASVGLPSDGRGPVAVTTFTRFDGQAEVWVCPTTWGYECASLGAVAGAPHSAIVVDPDSMTVAWTASDGTVHVRTLTP